MVTRFVFAFVIHGPQIIEEEEQLVAANGPAKISARAVVDQVSTEDLKTRGVQYVVLISSYAPP